MVVPAEACRHGTAGGMAISEIHAPGHGSRDHFEVGSEVEYPVMTPSPGTGAEIIQHARKLISLSIQCNMCVYKYIL